MPGFSRRSWLLVWLLPLLVVAGLVAALVASRPSQPVAAGVGDPYYPDAGATGWEPTSTVVHVTWNDDLTQLSGTTTLEGIATQNLSGIGFNLMHHVDAATLDGEPVTVAAWGAVNRVAMAKKPLDVGDRFTLEVSYAGSPDGLRTVGGFHQPYSRAGGEILIAGEPESSAVWYAANDHPSRAAPFEVYATVPAGLQAISIGELISEDADDDPATATWHWRAADPVASYLTFLAVGRFDIEQGDADGRPALYAVSHLLAPPERDRALAKLRETPRVIRELESRYGPYPFGEIGGVVTGIDTWFGALETQTRPVYGAALAAAGGDWPDELLAHELAHMWFGNHVRVATWADIVNNEGWATFAAQDVLARRDGRSMDDWLRGIWDEGDDDFWTPSISDPGVDNMFGTTYVRGGAALQALRVLLGDDAFFAIAREWAQTPGARSLADFQAYVDERSSRDLTAFWHAWYAASEAPPREAAYGWPG